MALYDYWCAECEVLTERFERPDMVCRDCGGELTRKFPGANVIYRGLGFFTTENRKVTEFTDQGVPKIW